MTIQDSPSETKTFKTQCCECGGTGKLFFGPEERNYGNCRRCEGTGDGEELVIEYSYGTCLNCDGSGKTLTGYCTCCNGTGDIQIRRMVSPTDPPLSTPTQRMGREDDVRKDAEFGSNVCPVSDAHLESIKTLPDAPAYVMQCKEDMQPEAYAGIMRAWDAFTKAVPNMGGKKLFIVPHNLQLLAFAETEDDRKQRENKRSS